jgi:hypothetical protein
VDKTTGLRSDQTILLTRFNAARDYPDKLRRVCFYDVQQQRGSLFPTNHFGLPALLVAPCASRLGTGFPVQPR